MKEKVLAGKRKWRPREFEWRFSVLESLESKIITSYDNLSFMRAMWLPNTFIYQTTAMRVDKITNELTFSGNLTENDESFLGKLLDDPDKFDHCLKALTLLFYLHLFFSFSRLTCSVFWLSRHPGMPVGYVLEQG